MGLQRLMTRYAAHNLWANERLTDFLKSGDRELCYREVPSSFNSIARTFNHILSTQEFWYSVVTGSKNTSRRWSEPNPDVEEVFQALIEHSRLTLEAVEKYSDEDLEELTRVKTSWFEGISPRYDYLHQMLNHATYHRGQIVTMCRALGLTDIPNTDYVFYNIIADGV